MMKIMMMKRNRMNSLKLLIENFQSISQGSLEFQTGLNFLIGQSNSGKSAIFRALKACLSNPSGSQRYIKHGSKQSIVTLKYNNNEITWKRTPKESSYEINGEQYVKTGSSNAFKILENSTGFVKDDNSDTILNIEEELQLLFPFGISKSDLFKLYENVFCISDSAVILKSAKEQEEVVKDEVEELEMELGKTSLKLLELQKFKEEVDISLLEGYRTTLKGKSKRLAILKDGLDLVKKAVKVSSVVFVPEGIELKESLKVYNEKLKDKEIFKSTKECCTFLKSFFLVSPSISGAKLNFYENLKDLKKTLNVLTNLDKALPADFAISDRLIELKELKNLKKFKETLRKIKSFKLPTLNTKSKYESYNEKKDLLNYIKRIKNLIREKEEAIERTEERIKEVTEKLSSFEVCPLCHQEIKGGYGEKNV